MTQTVTLSRGGTQGMRHQFRDTYHPQSRKINDSLVEMTLQLTTTGATALNKVPPGGDFAFTIDVERLAGNKTKLTWNGGPFQSSSWEKNKQWSEGKDIACGQS